MRRPTQMRLKDLTQVHARRDADGVQDDVHGCAVRQVGHVLFGKDASDHALVAVTPGHLVAFHDLTRLGNPEPDESIDAGWEFVFVGPGKDLDADYFALLSVGHPQRGVLNVASLLAEDGSEEFLLCAELGLALGRDLTDEDVARPDLCADANDTVLIQVS